MGVRGRGKRGRGGLVAKWKSGLGKSRLKVMCLVREKEGLSHRGAGGGRGEEEMGRRL